MTSEKKRKYERIDPEKYRSWDQPPPIKYENGKVVDRRAYDAWYSEHKRNYRRETPEAKAARYKRYSRDYWTNYCTENGLDPKSWKAVKERVESERRARRVRWLRGWG